MNLSSDNRRSGLTGAKMPSVSVVIPTYNRAPLLREALASVAAQTYPALDIAVVDDGSTDETASVVREFQEGGLPIVYLPGPHLNRLGQARNRGVAATRGEWVAFLDSDDLWLPQRLERQMETVEATPGAGFAFCNVQRFTAEGDMSGPYLDLRRDYSGRVTGALLEEPVALPSALMVSGDAFRRLGGFADRRINEDYELTLRLSALYPAAYTPEVLVRMRAHGGNRSLAMQREAGLEYLRIVEAFLAAHPELPPDAKASGRLGMANVHFKLAKQYAASGKHEAARKHALKFTLLRPLDRRGPALWLGSLARWAGR
jgi:glycosyltransferase involved in cell wall biosynthesis